MVGGRWSFIRQLLIKMILGPEVKKKKVPRDRKITLEELLDVLKKVEWKDSGIFREYIGDNGNDHFSRDYRTRLTDCKIKIGPISKKMELGIIVRHNWSLVELYREYPNISQFDKFKYEPKEGTYDFEIKLPFFVSYRQVDLTDFVPFMDQRKKLYYIIQSLVKNKK